MTQAQLQKVISDIRRMHGDAELCIEQAKRTRDKSDVIHYSAQEEAYAAILSILSDYVKE